MEPGSINEYFYLACKKGHLEVVKDLLRLDNPKVDYLRSNDKGETPFFIAC